MNLNKFKDLEVGDIVEYKDIYIHDRLTVSGRGRVYGFGRFDHTDLVWVEKDGGEEKEGEEKEGSGKNLLAVPYEEVSKVTRE